MPSSARPVDYPSPSTHEASSTWTGPGRRPGISRNAGQTSLVTIGVLLFLLGLYAFVTFQTQVMFTDNARISEIRPGLAPRNDGGILFGASLTGLGTGLMLAAMSPLRPRKRLVPFGVIVATTASLLWTHFTIFVNAILVPSARSADLTASFLFHDTASALPMATFILAIITLSFVFIWLAAALALVAPSVWQNKLRYPTLVDEHRTRLVIITLFAAVVGVTFVRQFIEYALVGDARPTGGFLNTNITVVYYLLSLATALAIATTSWRTYTVTWRDLHRTKSMGFRRAYHYLVAGETWLWGIALALNIVVLLAGPAYQPDARVDRVFSMNSKGVSVFFFILPALYALHRVVSREHVAHLMALPSAIPPKRLDTLAVMTVLLVGLWTILTVVLRAADMTSFGRLLVRVMAVAAALPFFAVRFDSSQYGRPQLRTIGSTYVLLSATAVAMLAGIMLWGSGNSITTRYVETGGFVSTVQPYATGVRVLGSLFLSLPATLGLWFLATRYRPQVHPGPLLVVAFSILIGMNLVLNIDAADPRDVTIGRTDVLVGFSIVSLTTAFDRVVLVSAWIATAAMGFLATALLIYRGSQPHPPGSPSAAMQ